VVKTLIVDPSKCTSCRLCELACSGHNAGAFQPSRAHVHVTIHVDEAFYFPRICLQCDDAPCIDACPCDALMRDPRTNAVVVQEDKCNECRTCEDACPYGAIRVWDSRVWKCELCGGDPECVRFCAPQALRYDSAEAWPAGARAAYADRLRELAKEVRP
jgi:anaerobic carbon-monoxide dehydrogenase iron sulfur subunit